MISGIKEGIRMGKPNKMVNQRENTKDPMDFISSGIYEIYKFICVEFRYFIIFHHISQIFHFYSSVYIYILSVYIYSENLLKNPKKKSSKATI